MSYEPWPRLEKPTRLAILAFGVLAWLAAVPAAFVGLMIFGFHGPLDEWGERIAVFALPMLPFLLFLLGLASFLAFTRRGLLIVQGLAAAAVLDLVLLVASFQLMNQPRERDARPIVAAPPATNRVMEAGPGPVQVGIACSVQSDECWTIRYENGREVSREKSTGPGR